MKDSDKLRILLLTDGIFPYVIGGMQKHSYYLTKYFLLEKVEITLVHCVPFADKIPSEKEVFDFLFKEENEEIKSPLRGKFKSICLRFPASGKLPGHYLRESFRYSEEVFNLIERDINSYDFIYAKGFSAWKLLEERKRGMKTPPIGVKFHGLNMFQKAASFRSKFEHLMFRPSVKFNMLNADVNFSYGGKITGITERVGVKPENIIEAPTGVLPSWFSDSIENHSPIRFLFIGRYERLKGIEELNEAIPLVKGKFEFHFIGPIPEDKKIKHSNVFYHGKIMDETLLKEGIHSCDVLVCPSYSEGMPNVIMEAMAQGLAVLATDVGATNILVNENTGWLMAECDSELIRKNLEEIIVLPFDKLQIKKESAQIHLHQKFNWEVIIKKLITEIGKITSRS